MSELNVTMISEDLTRTRDELCYLNRRVEDIRLHNPVPVWMLEYFIARRDLAEQHEVKLQRMLKNVEEA